MTKERKGTIGREKKEKESQKKRKEGMNMNKFKHS
jgi:hypothetical protein